MTGKPQYFSEYNSRHAVFVQEMCLYLATRLGDIMDELVIVGGMVPGLLIPQETLPRGIDPYCGTVDIDFGLALALFEGKRYQRLTERLRDAGFEPDTNERGRITTQRWKLVENQAMTVDFLVAPSSEEERQRRGKVRNIERDFAAIIAPGLHLAFADRKVVRLTGETIRKEQVSRDISVCGPAAFIVLKALAFADRGENKDAFDLLYVLKGFGSSIDDVVEHFKKLGHDSDIDRALYVIERDFTNENAIGPRRVSDFIHHRPDEETLADVVGYATRLLGQLAQRS